ncbi:cellulose binding domain-containing protein [Streptomyces enissocaesilis]|uniref:CBM3 domain-containing protein n=1 Tax=Streptomyces enissocaesilis TaxID=332589 RepID=A0ABP6K969_9ACTN
MRSSPHRLRTVRALFGALLTTGLPNDEGRHADPMRNPNCTAPKTAPKAGNGPIAGMPDASLSGHWLHDQPSMLLRNAQSAVPTDGGGDPDRTDTGLSASTAYRSTVRARDGGSPTVNAWCDHAVVGCANVALRVAPLSTPVAGTDAYLEIGFKSGSPAGRRDTCDPRLRTSEPGCSAFDEAGDYSRSTAASCADAPQLPVYAGGDPA